MLYVMSIVYAMCAMYGTCACIYIHTDIHTYMMECVHAMYACNVCMQCVHAMCAHMCTCQCCLSCVVYVVCNVLCFSGLGWHCLCLKEKGRMWVLAKAGKVKLMFNLSVVHMSSVLVCMCVLQGKMFWPPGKS